MELCKDKELCHLQRLCSFSPLPKSVIQKLIEAHLKQMSDLNYSVKLETSMYAGYTPLHFLAMSSIDENETIKLMKWLIDCGVNVNALNAIVSTVVHIAAEEDKRIVLEFLFSYEKLLMNVINKKGISYLHIACTMPSVEIAKKILNATGMQIINNQIQTLSYFRFLDGWVLDKIYLGGETALHAAVLSNNLDIVQLLIDHKVDLNRKDNKGLTPLGHATKNKLFRIETVLKEAMSKYPISITNSLGLRKIIHVPNCKIVVAGFTCLHRMCMDTNISEIENLLKQKINLNESISKDSPSWSGFTALHIAVKLDNLKIVELLLSSGADVNAKDEKGMSPLHLAVENVNLDVILVLINYKADLWTKSIGKMTPFHLALSKYDAQNSTSKKIVNFFLTAFQSKYRKYADDFGISLLHIACIINNPFIVMHCFQEDVRVDTYINSKSPLFPAYTSLHLAVNFQNSQIVRILLDKGVDYTLMNADGLTPLHLAQKLDNLETVELLFSACYFRADNPISSEGISHFHIACMRNKIEAVEKYMKHDVDVNQPIDFFSANELRGYTPLHIAVHECHVQLIKVLLNCKNILINSENSFGWSPLHDACHTDSKGEIVEMLLKNSADPNAEDFFGRRPIEIVIGKNNEAFLKILLRYKIAINYFNTITSFNPLHALVDSTELNYRMFRMLINKGADVTFTHENRLTILHKILSKDLIDYEDSNKITTLSLSRIISCLYWKGCDVDGQDEQGRTPLHVAIQNCNAYGALALLQNGANISIADNSGKVPIQYYERESMGDNFGNHFMSHMLKLIASNSYINRKNMVWAHLQVKAIYVRNNGNYVSEFVRELETMKQCKLSSYTTLYDVLHKAPSEMAILVENGILKNRIHSKPNFSATFLHYSNLLLAKYNKGMIWKNLTQPVKDSLAKLSNRLKLTDECFEEIFKYLTIDDVRRLIASCTSKP